MTAGGQFAELIDLGAMLSGRFSPITFVEPYGLTPGNQPIVVTINGVASARSVLDGRTVKLVMNRLGRLSL